MLWNCETQRHKTSNITWCCQKDRPACFESQGCTVSIPWVMKITIKAFWWALPVFLNTPDTKAHEMWRIYSQSTEQHGLVNIPSCTQHGLCGDWIQNQSSENRMNRSQKKKTVNILKSQTLFPEIKQSQKLDDLDLAQMNFVDIPEWSVRHQPQCWTNANRVLLSNWKLFFLGWGLK